jgi:hypothetical protein
MGLISTIVETSNLFWGRVNIDSISKSAQGKRPSELPYKTRLVRIICSGGERKKVFKLLFESELFF